MADLQKTPDRCNQGSEMDTFMQNLSEEHSCTNNNLLFTTAAPLLNQKPGESLSGFVGFLFIYLFWHNAGRVGFGLLFNLDFNKLKWGYKHEGLGNRKQK